MSEKLSQFNQAPKIIGFLVPEIPEGAKAISDTRAIKAYESAVDVVSNYFQQAEVDKDNPLFKRLSSIHRFYDEVNAPPKEIPRLLVESAVLLMNNSNRETR